jgi:hypothetical protein
MDVNIENIPVSLGNGENVYVSLRWFRSASRYNKGGTIHKWMHQMRLIFGRVKHKLQAPFLNKEVRIIYEKFDVPFSCQQKSPANHWFAGLNLRGGGETRTRVQTFSP